MVRNNSQKRYELDQSVRIEELNRDTVIGIGSKEERHAFVLPRKVKRRLNEAFRLQGQPKKCAPSVFAVAIVIAFRKAEIEPGSIIIDQEYAKHELLILDIVQTFFPQAVIELKRIGKRSPGHEAAYFTHIGKKKEDGIIQYSEIIRLLNIKKTAGEPHHLGFTRIHKSSQPVYRKGNRSK